MLHEKVQIVLPFGGVMSIAVDMPDMGNPLFLEVSVQSLADTDKAVFVAARQPKQFHFKAKRCDKSVARPEEDGDR
jgi:hypothetical protein